MADNPLFPDDDYDDSEDEEAGSIDGLSYEATDIGDDPRHRNPAAELVRRKVDSIYDDEPDLHEEEVEIQIAREETKQLSKHQRFLQSLTESGLALADVQNRWHNYYEQLPDQEKHEVWREFYQSNSPQSQTFQNISQKIQSVQRLPKPDRRPTKRRRTPTPPPELPQEAPAQVVIAEHVLAPPKKIQPPKIKRPRDDKVKEVAKAQRLKAKHHLQSLGFGLATGTLVIFIFLFGFFNEIFIAPFIQPSRDTKNIPIILSTDAAAISSTPEVIIPKINVEIPVDYTQTSTDINVIENALESGVVHYPTTVMPGQLGNAAFFGHSSNNIFNPGKYKFAFVLLHTLVPGDTFYLTYNGVNYVYQVFQTKVVPPSDVSVLGSVPGKAATATLITCDPPGTSINRLVVWGLQISPNPANNTPGQTVATTGGTPSVLPGNGPSLWSRFTHWLF